MIVVQASRSRTARKLPPNEDVIIAVVGRELCTSSLDFARDRGLSELRVLELLLDRQLNPYHLSRNAPLFPDDLPPGHFYDNLIDILRHLTGMYILTIKCVRTCI
jgi:hypothetical protein